MGLEVKLILHGHAGPVEVGNMFIQQVTQHEGSLRDYKVTSWWQPMITRGRCVACGGVERHDRNDPVWHLVAKAVASILEGMPR